SPNANEQTAGGSSPDGRGSTDASGAGRTAGGEGGGAAAGGEGGGAAAVGDRGLGGGRAGLGSTVASPVPQSDHLVYQGGFRLPASKSNGDNLGTSTVNYSNGAIAYNAAKQSLFIEGFAGQQSIAEFVLPALVNSKDLPALNMAAAPIQEFVRVL